MKALERLLVVLGLIVLVSQAYLAGARKQAKKDKSDMDYYMAEVEVMKDRALKHPTFKAGFESCMEQF